MAKGDPAQRDRREVMVGPVTVYADPVEAEADPVFPGLLPWSSKVLAWTNADYTAPWHPILLEVARWLDEHPDQLDQIKTVIGRKCPSCDGTGVVRVEQNTWAANYYRNKTGIRTR